MAYIRIFLLLSSLLIFPKLAWAEISWEEAIEAVEEKTSKYFDYAMKLGSGYPGTALNGLNHERHMCAIVGRMLGFRDEIRWAETIEDPPLVPHADPGNLMAHSMSLDAWVAAARRALSMTVMQRKNLWNLECVGNYQISISARIVDADLQGDFSIKDNTLIVYGEINDGFYQRFVHVLNDNPHIKSIGLGSAGGSVIDAILSGLEIRKRGLTTILHGPCYSACPLIFVGGTERLIWPGPGQNIGFHQVYSKHGKAISLKSEVYQHIAAYLLKMDVNPIVVIFWMRSAQPDAIFEPDLEDLCKFGVATWIQRTCGF